MRHAGDHLTCRNLQSADRVVATPLCAADRSTDRHLNHLIKPRLQRVKLATAAVCNASLIRRDRVQTILDLEAKRGWLYIYTDRIWCSIKITTLYCRWRALYNQVEMYLHGLIVQYNHLDSEILSEIVTESMQLYDVKFVHLLTALAGRSPSQRVCMDCLKVHIRYI
jgi:hypothetical protein